MTTAEFMAVRAKFGWVDKLGNAVDHYIFNGEEQQDPALFAVMIFRLPVAHRVKIAATLLRITEQRASALQMEYRTDEEAAADLERSLG